VVVGGESGDALELLALLFVMLDIDFENCSFATYAIAVAVLDFGLFGLL
jgi:hypothetical protein